MIRTARRLAPCLVVCITLLALACDEASQSSSRRDEPEPVDPEAVAAARRLLERASDDQLENILLIGLRVGPREEPARELEMVRGWTAGRRMLYTTSVLESEIESGGFAQYFWNTRGQFVKLAWEGLNLIGAPQHADLLKRADDIYRQEPALRPAPGREDDSEALAKAAEKSRLKTIDDEFAKLPALKPLRVKYIRGHLDEFTAPFDKR